MAKRTTTGRKPAAGGSRRPASRKRTTRPQPIAPSLRPEHQRELFALTLITIAAVTIVFFMTGSAGAFGERWVIFTQRLLGWGALLVPLSLGLLGIAILWQERHEDLQLTSATVSGTFLLLLALLALLEFALSEPRRDAADQFGRGGGLVGYLILALMTPAIGRPATFVIVCVVALAGVLLTFNITLYEIVRGLRDSWARFWVTVWSAAPSGEDGHEAEEAPARRFPTVRDAHAFVPPPGATPEVDDIVSTPIAARPTKASLFNRPEVKKAAPPPPAPAAPVVSPKAPAKPGPDTVLSGLLATPAPAANAGPAAKAVVAEPPVEVVQEALDGFEVAAVHRAWPLPSFEMLDSYVEGTITDEERRGKSRLIEETLASFKVEAQVIGVNTGP
ncbi:MAG TPA: DNA translocase FtsK 4TM domain-containing protein, partial [Roseiflexaceae bacterium]|nr:DNA translocase FtsK 4TM domain-containing protein [Roseiflexaceae bacterium]